MDTDLMEWNILCVKHGDKYSAEHVNRLYRMVEKNTSLPFSFYCLTEDPTGLECNVIPLDESLDMKAWWWKICLFDKDMPQGYNLYFDLDVVIQGNIDCLMEPTDVLRLIDYSTEETDGEDINEHIRTYYNSSIMVWKTGTHHDVYEKCISDWKYYESVYMGLDRFFAYEVDQSRFAPLPWVMYSRRTGPWNKQLEPTEKIKLRYDGSVHGVYHLKDYKVCVFNNGWTSEFYEGFEIYFV